MTLGYRILPAADRDIDDQAEYLAREVGLETALRFYDAVAITFSKLAPMPALGERWMSRNPRLVDLRVRRVEGFEKHLVFYRTAKGGVEIVRVLHGARDLDSILGSGENQASP